MTASFSSILLQSDIAFLRYGNSFDDIIEDWWKVYFERGLLKFWHLGKVLTYNRNQQSLFTWKQHFYIKSFNQLRKCWRFHNAQNVEINLGTIFSDILTLHPVTQNVDFRQLVPFDILSCNLSSSALVLYCITPYIYLGIMKHCAVNKCNNVS